MYLLIFENVSTLNAKLISRPLEKLKKIMYFVVFVVKPGHSRILLSNETEHVKVVDATSYIPSPNDQYASPAIMSPAAYSNMLDSPADNDRQILAPRRRVRRR